MSKQTAVRLPDELNERLMSLANRTGRTASYYLREALEEYIDEMEDIYLAEQALAQVRSGEQRTYSLDEVERELGLAN